MLEFSAYLLGSYHCAEFAGIMRPAGRLPALEESFGRLEQTRGEFFAPIRDGFCLFVRSHSRKPRGWNVPRARGKFRVRCCSFLALGRTIC